MTATLTTTTMTNLRSKTNESPRRRERDRAENEAKSERQKQKVLKHFLKPPPHHKPRQATHTKKTSPNKNPETETVYRRHSGYTARSISCPADALLTAGPNNPFHFRVKHVDRNPETVSNISIPSNMPPARMTSKEPLNHVPGQEGQGVVMRSLWRPRSQYDTNDRKAMDPQPSSQGGFSWRSSRLDDEDGDDDDDDNDTNDQRRAETMEEKQDLRAKQIQRIKKQKRKN